MTRYFLSFVRSFVLNTNMIIDDAVELDPRALVLCSPCPNDSDGSGGQERFDGQEAPDGQEKSNGQEAPNGQEGSGYSNPTDSDGSDAQWVRLSKPNDSDGSDAEWVWLLKPNDSDAVLKKMDHVD